jgi:hypothetical protein
MTKLASIRQRLNNPNLCRIEWLQRDSFLTALQSFKLTNAHALSVSCGDGIWDYLALLNRTGIAMVTATDIVPCPVKAETLHCCKQSERGASIRFSPINHCLSMMKALMWSGIKTLSNIRGGPSCF